MAKFKAADVVERIEWDFVGVPHVNASVDDREPKTVSGAHVTGTLVEPDPDTASRFAEAHEQLIADALAGRQATIKRLIAASDDSDDELEPADVSAEVLGTAAAYVAQYEQAIAALRILQVPAELLEQLPPRFVSAFLNYVAGELQGEGGAA